MGAEISPRPSRQTRRISDDDQKIQGFTPAPAGQAQGTEVQKGKKEEQQANENTTTIGEEMTPKKAPKRPKQPHKIPNRMVRLKGSSPLRKRNTQTMPRRK